MPTITASPAFAAFVYTCVLLSLNLLVLWVCSGAVRARGGVAINPEDGARHKVPVREFDPPSVARVLRIHRNAEATSYPFMILGLVYVLAGGRARIAVPIFAAFTAARIVHSIVYLRGMQPWRTVAFAASLLASIALIVATLLLMS